jgi:hypothetical protein
MLGSGNVICVDLFISARYTDRARFGYGDNRTYDANSDPSQSRAYLYLYLDDKGTLLRYEPHIAEKSCTQVGCFKTNPQNNHFWASQDPKTGEITVEWRLENGFSSFVKKYAEVSRGFFPGLANGAYISAEVVLPDINGELTIGRRNGRYEVLEMNRDPYPSLEVYHYRNGRFVREILTRPESRFGPFYGLNPLARNEVIRRR